MSEYDFFISHSHRDRVWASALVSSLKKRGFRVWWASHDIRARSEWPEIVKSALKSSTFVVTLLDPRDPERPNILFEAGMAIALGKRVALLVPPSRAKASPITLREHGRVLQRKTPASSASDLIKWAAGTRTSTTPPQSS